MTRKDSQVPSVVEYRSISSFLSLEPSKISRFFRCLNGTLHHCGSITTATKPYAGRLATLLSTIMWIFGLECFDDWRLYCTIRALLMIICIARTGTQPSGHTSLSFPLPIPRYRHFFVNAEKPRNPNIIRSSLQTPGRFRCTQNLSSRRMIRKESLCGIDCQTRSFPQNLWSEWMKFSDRPI